MNLHFSGQIPAQINYKDHPRTMSNDVVLLSLLLIWIRYLPNRLAPKHEDQEAAAEGVLVKTSTAYNFIKRDSDTCVSL